MFNWPRREPQARIRVVFDGDNTRIYVNDVLVRGAPLLDFDLAGWGRYGDPTVRLVFRNPEIEIQHVDPDARLDMHGQPNLIDGAPIVGARHEPEAPA